MPLKKTKKPVKNLFSLEKKKIFANQILIFYIC